MSTEPLAVNANGCKITDFIVKASCVYLLQKLMPNLVIRCHPETLNENPVGNYDYESLNYFPKLIGDESMPRGEARIMDGERVVLVINHLAELLSA